MVGQPIGLKVIEVNQARRRLILSQREAQREWRTQQKQRLLTELKVGDIVKGRVTGIRDFGVFVNLGGADGLIHVSELAWHRVPHPGDVVSIGQEIDVYILELDAEQQRIALSLRRTQPDPWHMVEKTYQIGQIVQGEVSNVVDFGAFMVLPDGIEGLLHITEMADGTLTEPHSYLKRGDKVSVKIVRIEPERRRIGFTQAGLNLTEPTQEPSENVVSIRREDLAPPGELPSPTEILTGQNEVTAEEAEGEDESELPRTAIGAADLGSDSEESARADDVEATAAGEVSAEEGTASDVAEADMPASDRMEDEEDKES